MKLTVYLSGEIHSDWRDQIISGIQADDLPIEVLSPVTDHSAGRFELADLIVQGSLR